MNFSMLCRSIKAGILVSALGLGSCQGSLTTKETIDVAGYPLEVEIADTPEKRSQGLMDRRRLPDNHGMLFVFQKESKVVFWMKNTSIPLSIAFIGSDGRIKQIEDMQPYSLDSVESRRSVRFALEVNRGWFSDKGISPGDRVVLPERFQ